MDCTDAVCELLGYSRTELLSKTIDEISFDRARVEALFARYIGSGLQQGDYVLQHKSGAPVYVKYRARVFDDGCLAASWTPAEEWEQLYFAALLEFNPQKLPGRVASALRAIQQRKANLKMGADVEIHVRLEDAILALRALSH